MSKSIASSFTRAFSSIFGAVESVAVSGSRIVESATSGVDMIDTFVSKAKEQQRVNTALEMETFYEQAAESAALNNAKRKQETIRMLENDTQLTSLYEKEYKHLEAVVNKLRTKETPKD